MTGSCGDGSPLTTAWEEVLDRMEAELGAIDAALDAGELMPLPTWVPPHDLEAMPPSVGERAGELRARLRRTHGRIRDHLLRLGEELHEVQRQRRAGDAYTRSG